MLRTESLVKVFQAADLQTTALNNIDFRVKTGEFVAIMGPSGCGKSTLMNIMGLLDTPTSGNYYFMGKNVASLPEKKRAQIRKANIGFIFQNFNLIDELTVYENVELPLIYLGTGRDERKTRVAEMLDKLELGYRKNHFPVQLSGGQQQQVAVARSLIANPSLILADEPTGNLDSARGEDIMNFLTTLNEGGTTIVMVTHSQRDAEFSSRIVNLFDGRIVSERY
ncbi:MAG: ABC transporter ATP-binding protein [Bacteroidota bacterium]